MAIYKNEAVTETIFPPCPKHRLRLMSAKLFKTESLGAHCGEKGVAAGMLDRVKAWKSQWGRVTRTQNQVGSRERFNTHLRPRWKRQSTSSPGALQHGASPAASPNFTHTCSPVEVFSPGFWCAPAEPYYSKHRFSFTTSPRLNLNRFDPNFCFLFCGLPPSSRQMQRI